MFIRDQYGFNVNVYYWSAWVSYGGFAFECYDNL